MSGLREAAQEAEAALELMPCGCSGGCRTGEEPHWFECSRCKALAAVRAALALPPEPGWAGGAEAMREAAARGLRKHQAARKPSPARDALIEAEHFVRALPIPPAPAREPLTFGVQPHDVQRAPESEAAIGEVLAAASRMISAPSPEAKPAESEVFWCVRATRPRAVDIPQPWHPNYDAALLERDTLPGAQWEIVKVTVEPAPVEPEETP